MEQIRFEATQVIAPQGKGKTQLLQRQILKDIRDPDKPYVIVIDSRGQMLPVLRKLKDFEGNDRLIYLSPDMGNGYSPALNMFAPSKRNYTGILKESIEAGVLESFHYIFENIMELSSRQDTAFSFLVRLMLSMKVANITTLHDVIDDQLHLGAKASLESSAYRDDILKLDDTAIRFFRNVYFTKGYGVTRQAISERLYGLVNIPSFKRMFDAPR